MPNTNTDPFKNVVGIPVGQDAENLALNTARSGACVSGGFRSGFIATAGDVPDLHDIPTPGSIVGGDFAWRDRYLPPAPDPPAEDQAPTVTSPGTQTADFNVPFTFSVAGGNPIIVADIDSNGGIEELTLSLNAGILGNLPEAFIVSGGNGTATAVLHGTIDELNAAMDGMTVTIDDLGGAQLEVTIDDQGNSGVGGPISDGVFITINISGGGG